MWIINAQNYIKKDIIKNHKTIWWSKLEAIEASAQPQAALVKAAATDKYYERFIN